MAQYHVGCGMAGIYAGTISKPGMWKVKNDVTDEALCAVADYMKGKITGDNDTYEITWKLPDKDIILSLTVKKKNEEK